MIKYEWGDYLSPTFGETVLFMVVERFGEGKAKEIYRRYLEKGQKFGNTALRAIAHLRNSESRAPRNLVSHGKLCLSCLAILTNQIGLL
ncbi:hypothetical protein [Scytonema sp. NUACC26]|uniref:hypothetical protein n=1 Tax=Scytonema sp. NUACC26 TaxID=3140176 RepID=UPI0034DC9C21